MHTSLAQNTVEHATVLNLEHPFGLLSYAVGA
jgi:hypothetical protein